MTKNEKAYLAISTFLAITSSMVAAQAVSDSSKSKIDNSGSTEADTEAIATLRNYVLGPGKGQPGTAPLGWEYVGEIPPTCPILIIRKNGKDEPPGFTITPEKAVSLSALQQKLPVKCNSIFQQVVYADATRYFILKSVFMTDAVIIDGHSGAVRVHRSH